MALLVQKFGGTSVGDPDRVKAVADHVARCRRRGDRVAMVVSAMGKETDDLLHLAEQVSNAKPGREMDMLITAGERKAVAVVCMALHDLGVKAQSFTGSQAGFITDTSHQNAKIMDLNPHRIEQALADGMVPVVAGSQGVSTEKDITFLGRGGSDTTAVALADALDADECELYTDVSGVYTADPRLVSDAVKIPTIGFDELLELTAAGCPKPALRSVELAEALGVRLHVRSAFTWERGTMAVEQEEVMESPLVRGVTHEAGHMKVTVIGIGDSPGMSALLFNALLKNSVNVDMIVQNSGENGKADISFTCVETNRKRIEEALNSKLLAEVSAFEVVYGGAIARVSIVGAGMKSNPGVAARMFEVLGEAGINIDMISTSPIRISCVVDEEQAELAVVKLHDAFELSRSGSVD